MAQTLTIVANRRQEYALRAIVAGQPVELLVDTGFTDASGDVGVSLDTATFRRVAGRLRDPMRLNVGLAEDDFRSGRSGVGKVELIGLDNSEMDTRIVESGANLLGVGYFHGLQGFLVTWDLAARTMTITRRV